MDKNLKPLLSIYSIFCFLTLQAHQTPLRFSTSGVSISSGLSSMNTSVFNVYTNGKVGQFKSLQKVYGVEMFGVFKHCMIGGSANIIHGDNIKTDTFKYKLSGFSINVNWGYKMYTHSNFIFFPMVSTGISGYGINIKQLISPYQVENTYYNPRNLKINTISPYCDFSLNTYATLSSKKKSKAIGVKIGYSYGLKNSNWMYTGGSMTEGPKFGFRMLYLKVTFGVLKQSI